MYTLKMSGMGRGLYSTKLIPRGTVIFKAELLVLNERDTKIVNTTDFQYYTFKYNQTQDCLVMGNGEIFNHSDNPNVAYKLVNFEGRKVMQFSALCDIPEGKQLFIDYAADTEVDSSKYTVNLI